MKYLIQSPCFFVVIIPALLFSGCDDTKIDPAKKKERYKTELVSVYTQIIDVFVEMESMKDIKPGEFDVAKHYLEAVSRRVDVFLNSDISKCPSETKPIIGKLKDCFRELQQYLRQIEVILGELQELYKKDDPDMNRARTLLADMNKISRSQLNSWKQKMEKPSTEFDEIAKKYDIDPEALAEEMGLDIRGKTPPKRPAWAANSRVKPSGSTSGIRRRVPITEPIAEPSETRPAPKSEKPAPPKIMTLPNGELDTVAYMQPVYDHLFTHVEKLIALGRDSNASSRDRLAAAERAMKFIEHYRGSNFPDDFLESLENLRRDISAYVESKEQKPSVEKIVASMKNTNAFVELYGCIVYELP